MRFSAILATALAIGLSAPAARAEFSADKELVAKARQEGSIVLYTANQLESEQLITKRFNDRFPDMKVEVVRAPCSRLIARVEAEAASGNLRADVIEFSDVGLARKYENLFADYTPPNADKYPKSVRAVSPKFWPKTTWGYVLSYNSALVKSPPKSWDEVTKPEFKEKLGIIPAGAGGTTWTLAMFQRQALGEGHWKALAKKQYTMFPSDSPLASAIVRGEVRVGPLKSNSIIPMMAEGAPIGIVYPTDGVPITISAAGIGKNAAPPAAAKLYMDWVLSDEGQGAWVETSGGFTLLEGGAMPKGAEAGKVKLWVPDVDQYASLRDKWVAEWNDTFNYRQ
jgi:iron(III) transport system substrate-binding protein